MPRDDPARRARDKNFILHQELWPWKSMLPMKKYSAEPFGWPTFGLLYPDNLTQIVEGTLFGGTAGTPQTWDYASVDDLLDDGWLVD